LAPIAAVGDINDEGTEYMNSTVASNTLESPRLANDGGVSLLEYALLASLITVVSIATVILVGLTANGMYESVRDTWP
jgi:Flp pilus assembly pilin Flp